MNPWAGSSGFSKTTGLLYEKNRRKFQTYSQRSRVIRAEVKPSNAY